jgi:hypothetical protein
MILTVQIRAVFPLYQKVAGEEANSGATKASLLCSIGIL